MVKLLLALLTVAHAEVSPRNALIYVQRQYAPTGSIAKFVTSIREEISDEDFTFLSQHTSNPLVGAAFPTLTVQGSDSLRVEFHGVMVTLKVVSLKDRMFSINNKPLDFADRNLSNLWENIGEALPRARSAGWLQWILPAAYATPESDLTAFQATLAGAVLLTLGADNPCKEIPTYIKHCEEINTTFGAAATAAEDVKAKSCAKVGNRLFALMEQSNDMQKDKRCKAKAAALAQWHACLDKVEAKREQLGCPGTAPTFDGPPAAPTTD